MKHDAFQYEFTGKELVYYLFKKKVCPNCGGKLLKSKTYESIEGYKLNTTQEAFFVSNAKVKRYRHVFLCPKCKGAYPISELAKRERSLK